MKRRCPYCRNMVEVVDSKLSFHRTDGGPGLPLCFGAALHVPTLEALGEM